MYQLTRKFLLFLAAISIVGLGATPSANAESARAKCAAIGQQTKSAKGDLSGGEALAATALTGLVGLAITAAVKSDQGEQAGRAAERNCLLSHGLISKADIDKTPSGAKRVCNNQATSCSGALSSCLHTCNERNRGRGCHKDCNAAVSYCRSSGTWQTANCIKTGMAQ